ncbi:MAG: HDOD domain-containing protein [Candidatus Riflebacteria bacterium]|nr:HDOD domain-containing protein [Candidatus Riflebacteria bacterium]
MTQQYPFQIRNHGENVIEIIVGDVVKPEHKITEALHILLKKFEFVILSLKPTASLHPSFAESMAELSAAGKLLVVACEDEQIQVDLHQARKFADLKGAQHRVEGERNVSKILKHISSLAPLQSSANKLMHMLRNPDVKFEDIEEVTRKDPKLVMRMLKIANSAFFMRRMPFEDLKAVVTFLGIDGIRQIILHETFEGFAQVFANQRDKLAHMRRCAHLAAYIGKLLGGDQSFISKISSAGMLHDLGALALCFYDSKEYSRVTMKIRNDRKTVCEAELEVFGIDHQELGQLLAPKMGMPDYLGPVMGRHHDRTVPVDNHLLIAVMIANGYLNQQIERLSFTPYEQYLSVFNEERRKRKSTASLSKKSSGGETKIAEIAADQDKDSNEIFKIPQLYDVLKKELDKFIMAGPEGMGM